MSEAVKQRAPEKRYVRLVLEPLLLLLRVFVPEGGASLISSAGLFCPVESLQISNMPDASKSFPQQVV
jgi:hypothetical protein